MKAINYLKDTKFYGERCRLVIVFDKLFVAVSRDRRKRLIEIAL